MVVRDSAVIQIDVGQRRFVSTMTIYIIKLGSLPHLWRNLFMLFKRRLRIRSQHRKSRALLDKFAIEIVLSFLMNLIVLWLLYHGLRIVGNQVLLEPFSRCTVFNLRISFVIQVLAT